MNAQRSRPSSYARRVAELTTLRAELATARAQLSPFQCVRPFGPLAWTGGDRPRPLGSVSRPECAYVRALFREQANTHAAFWRGAKTEWDTLRTFYRRARADAHATFRGAFNG